MAELHSAGPKQVCKYFRETKKCFAKLFYDSFNSQLLPKESYKNANNGNLDWRRTREKTYNKYKLNEMEGN